jgi:hypothetical protein
VDIIDKNINHLIGEIITLKKGVIADAQEARRKEATGEAANTPVCTARWTIRA